jgi:hypothetical protein
MNDGGMASLPSWTYGEAMQAMPELLQGLSILQGRDYCLFRDVVWTELVIGDE